MTIIIYNKPKAFHDATNHGPAAGVIPVFIPLNPEYSNKFVLLHFIVTYFFYSFINFPSYYFHIIIFWIILFFLAQQDNIPKSNAFEKLDLFESPWGLQNFVYFNPIYLAILFIYLINKSTYFIAFYFFYWYFLFSYYDLTNKYYFYYF